MEFDITLTAKTTDEGGLVASFSRQLAQFGGQETLISESPVHRVDSSDGTFWFQCERIYHIVLVDSSTITPA